MRQFGIFYLMNWLRSKNLAYHCVVWIAAINFVIVYNYCARDFLNLHQYLLGYERLPYQSRVLMAWLAQPLVVVLHNLGVDGLLATHLPPFNQVDRVVLILLNLLSLVTLVYLLRHYLKWALKDSRFANLGALLVFVILPFNLITYPSANYWFPYDLSSVTFFFGLFLLGLYQRWIMFFCVFVLASLNRETAIFVCGILLLMNINRMPWWQACLLFLFQLLVFLGIKFWIIDLFKNNPLDTDVHSGLYMNQLQTNFQYLKNVMWWPSLAASFGFLWLPVMRYFNFIRSSELAIPILCFPLYALIMLWVGQIVELRIFVEYTPFFLLAALMIFHRLFLNNHAIES